MSSVLIRERRRQQLPQKDYTIRVSELERGKCGIIRATFVVKMPDSINPRTEFWVLTFCCDLHRFDSDMATVRFPFLTWYCAAKLKLFYFIHKNVSLLANFPRSQAVAILKWVRRQLTR